MSKNRTWREHAVEYVKSNNECPGDVPPFGSPDQIISEDDFLLSMKAGGTHPWDGCHFVEEVLGLETEGIKEVNIGRQQKAYQSGTKRKEVLLKNNLVRFVGRIEFRGNGSLYIPKELLHLEDYVQSLLSDALGG